MYGCVTIYVKIKRNKKNMLPSGLPVRRDQSPREAVLILWTVFIGRAHWPRCYSCSWRPSIQHLQNTTKNRDTKCLGEGIVTPPLLKKKMGFLSRSPDRHRDNQHYNNRPIIFTNSTRVYFIIQKLLCSTKHTIYFFTNFFLWSHKPFTYCNPHDFCSDPPQYQPTNLHLTILYPWST